MRNGFFVFFLLLISSACVPENEITPNFDQVKVEECLNYYWDLYDANLLTNIDSAIYYGKEIKGLGQKSGAEKWVAGGSAALGYAYLKKGNFGEAVDSYLQAVKIYKDTGDLEYLASVYNSLGDLYARAKDFNEALKYFSLANDIFFYKGNKAEKAEVNRNLAICYNELKDYQKAGEAIRVSLKAASEIGDFSLMSQAYSTLGVTSFKKQDYIKAREWYGLSVQYADSLSKGERMKAIAYHNIAETYFLEGNIELAKEWFNRAVILKERVGDPLSTLYSYNLLAQILINEGKYQQAIDTLSKGMNNIGPSIVSSAVEESLILVVDALNKISEKSEENRDFFSPDFVKRYALYSNKLAAYNQNLSETREGLLNISRQQSAQAAVERYAFNEQLKASKEVNEKMRYAFLIPVILLIIAIVSVYMAVKKNMHYKKLYSNIEQVLNNSKALRHLK